MVSILDKIEDRIYLFKNETGKKPSAIHLTSSAIKELNELYAHIPAHIPKDNSKAKLNTVLGLNIIIDNSGDLDNIHLS